MFIGMGGETGGRSPRWRRWMRSFSTGWRLAVWNEIVNWCWSGTTGAFRRALCGYPSARVQPIWSSQAGGEGRASADETIFTLEECVVVEAFWTIVDGKNDAQQTPSDLLEPCDGGPEGLRVPDEC